MNDRPEGHLRIGIIVAAVAAALAIGFLIGVLVLRGNGDGERVVRLDHEPVGSGAPAVTKGSLSIEDDGRAVSAGEVRRIVKAATTAVKGGRVTEIERSDDPGEAFEVEVVRRGMEFDVALDQNLDRVPNERFSD